MTMLFVTVIAHLLISTLPGDQLTMAIGSESSRPLSFEARQQLMRQYGFDRPWVVRYLSWLGAAARGDLGRSWRTGRPVTVELAECLGPTLRLNAAALVLLLPVALLLGWSCAWFLRPAWDGAIDLALLTLYAAPPFWLALFLQQQIAVQRGWLPLFGDSPLGAGMVEQLRHLLLPALCLALHALAFQTRFVRQATLAGWRSVGCGVAQAAGISKRRRFVRFGIGASLLPLGTMAGTLVPALVTGSVLVERIFGLHGAGHYFVDAVRLRDLPAALGVITIGAAATIAGALIAELVAPLADPRHEAYRS